jgi:membrane-associated phospholipid phosphatase
MTLKNIHLRVRNGDANRLRKLSHNLLLREGAILLGLYWFYSLIRWFVARDSPYEAFENAFKLIRLEKQLGIFYEPTIQSQLIDHARGMVHLANLFYTWGYFPVLLLTGVLLYRFERERFQTFKLTFLLGLGLALVCFSLFPLAPPRMLPEVGFVDTQRIFGSNLYNQKSVVSFYNPYAAMPSLHFGWALLVGIMAFSFDRRALKVGGMLYPCCMAVVIVTTGHHYLLDIAGGGVVVGLAYSLVKTLSRARSAFIPVSAATYTPGSHGKKHNHK